MVGRVEMSAASSLVRGLQRFGSPSGRGQEGQILLFVLLLLVFGSLVIMGFLLYTGTQVTVRGQDTEHLLARYAAEAGVADVLSDLIQGEDALSPGYVVPTPTVNDYNVALAIGTPTPGTEPTPIYQYLDPGARYGLSSLSGQTHYYLRMDNVKAGSPMRVNWVFTPNNQRWKIKLYAGTGPPGAPAPTIIAQDNFESGGWSGGSGWLGGWYHTGDSSLVTTDNPYEGTYHLRLRRGTGYVDRAVNLSGRTNVRLQFWAKASSFEPGETTTCSVSPDDINWTVVRVWQDGEDDNVYRFEDIDLSSFPMTSQFWIAFDAGMSDVGDYFWVDDIKIVSQALSPPVAQKSDTKGPGMLLVDGSLITGGTYTLDFFNNSATALVSASFSATGGTNYTWVYAQAYKDYVIAATAGDSTITIYVRQAPGYTEPTTGQRIYIEAWKEP